MNNAEKFKQVFGLYATELWSMPESDFLAWLNRDVETTQIDHIADISKKVSISCGQENDMVSRRAEIDAMKDMYRAAEKWLRDATDDVTKARAESCMATLVEIKLRTEKLSAAQPEPCVNTIDALNESIKHFDDMAEECRRNANIERNDYMDMRDNAYEAQQLAQWLNELKYLREKIEQITNKQSNHMKQPLPEPYRGGDSNE